MGKHIPASNRFVPARSCHSTVFPTDGLAFCHRTPSPPSAPAPAPSLALPPPPAVPKTQYLLDYLTPNAALLRVLAFGVVMWDQCLPTEDWLSSNIPTVIRSAVAKAHHRAANKLLQTADEDDELDAPTGGLGHTLLMYSHMLAGGILTMGIRYAGTERTDVRDIMLAHLKGFMEVHLVMS